MSTGHRGAYIRGVENLREDDGVDAGLVSDCLVNNCGHLYDAHHGHIVNFTAEDSSDVLSQTEPSEVEWRLIERWPFNMIRAVDGGSATVVYRLGFFRDGGSGDVYVGVRIGTDRIEPFLGDARAYQATDSTSSTSPTVTRGTLYVPAAVIDSRHPGMVLTGPANGAGFPARSGYVRSAWFEVWCLFDGSKPTVSLSSVMARQYARQPESLILTEGGEVILTEGGEYLIEE